jgi:hypothetical protein
MLRVFREDGAVVSSKREIVTHEQLRVLRVSQVLDGHGGKDMSDLYDKIKEEAAFHGIWAERVWFRIRAALSCTEWTEKHRRSWHS